MAIDASLLYDYPICASFGIIGFSFGTTKCYEQLENMLPAAAGPTMRCGNTWRPLCPFIKRYCLLRSFYSLTPS